MRAFIAPSGACAWCGEPIPAKPPGQPGPERTYCSHACRQAAYEARHPLGSRTLAEAGIEDVSLLELLAAAGIEAPSVVAMLAESHGPVGLDDFYLLDALADAGVAT